MVVALLFASRHLQRTSKQLGSGANYITNSSSHNWRGDKFVEPNSHGYLNQAITNAYILLVGCQVELKKIDGKTYEGVFETISPKNEITLSHAALSVVENGGDDDGTSPHSREAGSGDTKLVFPFCDVVHMRAAAVDLDFAKKDQVLLTDTAISGGVAGGTKEKTLERWRPEDAIDGGRDIFDVNNLHNGSASWDFDDMIRVNEEQHGFKSSFDSTMSTYMSPLERRDDDEFRQIERKAEQMAREIQNDARFKENEILDSGVSEEQMFSSVERSQNPPSPSSSGGRGGGAGGGDAPTTGTGGGGGKSNFNRSKSSGNTQWRGTPIVGPRLQQKMGNRGAAAGNHDDNGSSSKDSNQRSNTAASAVQHSAPPPTAAPHQNTAASQAHTGAPQLPQRMQNGGKNQQQYYATAGQNNAPTVYSQPASAPAPPQLVYPPQTHYNGGKPNGQQQQQAYQQQPPPQRAPQVMSPNHAPNHAPPQQQPAVANGVKIQPQNTQRGQPLASSHDKPPPSKPHEPPQPTVQQPPPQPKATPQQQQAQLTAQQQHQLQMAAQNRITQVIAQQEKLSYSAALGKKTASGRQQAPPNWRQPPQQPPPPRGDEPISPPVTMPVAMEMMPSAVEMPPMPTAPPPSANNTVAAARPAVAAVTTLSSVVMTMASLVQSSAPLEPHMPPRTVGSASHQSPAHVTFTQVTHPQPQAPAPQHQAVEPPQSSAAPASLVPKTTAPWAEKPSVVPVPSPAVSTTEQAKRDQKADFTAPPERRKEEVVQKFGKIHARAPLDDEKKPTANISELKKFSQGFKLPENKQSTAGSVKEAMDEVKLVKAAEASRKSSQEKIEADVRNKAASAETKSKKTEATVKPDIAHLAHKQEAPDSPAEDLVSRQPVMETEVVVATASLEASELERLAPISKAIVNGDVPLEQLLDSSVRSPVSPVSTCAELSVPFDDSSEKNVETTETVVMAATTMSAMMTPPSSPMSLSKLNPSAKAFTMNVGAKEFSPMGAGGVAPSESPEPSAATGLPLHYTAPAGPPQPIVAPAGMMRAPPPQQRFVGYAPYSQAYGGMMYNPMMAGGSQILVQAANPGAQPGAPPDHAGQTGPYHVQAAGGGAYAVSQPNATRPAGAVYRGRAPYTRQYSGGGMVYTVPTEMANQQPGAATGENAATSTAPQPQQVLAGGNPAGAAAFQMHPAAAQQHVQQQQQYIMLQGGAMAQYPHPMAAAAGQPGAPQVFQVHMPPPHAAAAGAPGGHPQMVRYIPAASVPGGMQALHQMQQQHAAAAAAAQAAAGGPQQHAGGPFQDQSGGQHPGYQLVGVNQAAMLQGAPQMNPSPSPSAAGQQAGSVQGYPHPSPSPQSNQYATAGGYPQISSPINQLPPSAAGGPSGAANQATAAAQHNRPLSRQLSGGPPAPPQQYVMVPPSAVQGMQPMQAQQPPPTNYIQTGLVQGYHPN